MENKWKIEIGSMLLVALLSACGGNSDIPTSDPLTVQQTAIAQTVEAERAIANAVAATLTAENAAPTASATTAPPTATSAASTAVVPTATPVPPTATATAEILVIAESDVDGNDGNDFIRSNSASNNGRVVLLPGLQQNELTETVTFNGRIALRVAVFDSRVGQQDGDGIQTVTFSIIDNFSGDTAFANTEEQAPFCLFGGNDPGCTTFVFAQNGLRWPSGVPIYNDSYTAQIDIVALNGDETQWRWLFQVQGAAARPIDGSTTTIDFTGAWYTNFAEVTLQQNGSTVTGGYSRYGYNESLALTGEVSDNVLSGYFGDNPADRFSFALSADGNTFTGSWLYRADGRERDWCGIRVGLGALPDGCGFSGDWLTVSDYAPASQPTARLQQVGPNVSGTFFNGSTSGTLSATWGNGVHPGTTR
ncbi:MAG: hypothetical protein R2932_14030 [Caldilineaceae bacterium]